MSANPFEEPAAGGREATVVHIDRKPESDGPASFILKARLDTILKVTRFINVLNGIGLAFSCYFAFTVVSGSITRFFLALYIGLFAVLLLAFELRVKATEPTVKRLFGFMYSYTGRTAFLCFVGAINFGFIDTGAAKSATGTKVVIAIGVFTVVNAVFNCFVLCKHPAFKAKPAGELGQPAAKMSDEEMMAYIRAHPELVAGAGQAARSENPFEAQAAQAAPARPAPSAPPAPTPSYAPPVVPKSPAVAKKPAVFDDDGENPFAQ